MKRKTGNMSLKNYKKILDSLNDLDQLSLIILGIWGEPTLNKDLFNMISFTKEKQRYQVNMTTNGSKFIDTKYCIDLFKSGLDKVMISFRTTEKNDIHRNLPKKFNYQKYVDSILNIISLKYQYNVNTKIQICLFKNTFYSKFSLSQDEKQFINKRLINDLLKGISKIIKKRVPTYDKMTQSFSRKISNATVISLSDDLLIELDALSVVTSLAEKYKNPQKCLLANHGACLGLHNHFSVLWDGRITTCYADMQGNNCLGNALENNIVDILSNDKSLYIYDSLRKYTLPTLTCRICRGGLTRTEKWGNFIGNMLFYNKYMIKRIPSEDWMIKKTA